MPVHAAEDLRLLPLGPPYKQRKSSLHCLHCTTYVYLGGYGLRLDEECIVYNVGLMDR